MARLSVSFDDIWANVDFPDQITLGKQISFAKTTNSPGDIGIALSIYSPDINLVSSDVQGPGIDRHKLTLQIGFSATSTSFTVPLSSWAEVTNKNKIAFQVEATAVTTSGLGTTARTTVYAVADQSMAPTFTLGVSPSNGAIQGITPVTISISGESCKYGASVASRSINADGRSSGGSSLSITTISNGVIAVSATVKDSRGLSTTKTATFSVTAYSPPTLRSFSVARVNSSGAADPEGTLVKFSVAWERGSGDTGGNTCTVKYRQAGVGAYVDCGEVVSGEEYVITGVAFSTDYEYEFIAVIADKHRPIEKSVILERGFFTLDFKKGGDGMAIGQACTEPGLTINMPTKFRQSLSFEAPAKKSLLDLFYPVGAIYLSFSSTHPQTLFGGTWQQLTGRFLRMANDTGTGGSDQMTASMLPAHSHGLNNHTHSFSWTGSHSHTPYRNDVGNNAKGRARYYKTNAAGGSQWGMVSNDSSGGTGNLMISSTSITVSGNTGGNSGQTTNAGSGDNQNNMPAYQNVYAWRRTA